MCDRSRSLPKRSALGCAIAIALASSAQAQVFTWSAGDFLANGFPNPVPGGTVINAVAGEAKSVSGRVIIDGRLNWISTETLAFTGAGSTLRNNGNVDFKSDSWIRPLSTNNVFDNAGTLRKSAGSGELWVDTMLTNRSGAVLDADSGIMRYRANGTLEAGSVFTGRGQHIFETTGTYIFHDNFVGADNNVTLLRGIFASGGSERLDVRTNLTWAGGTLQGNWVNGGAQTLTATAGRTDKTLVGSFVNDGRINWLVTDTLAFSGAGTTLRNNGNVDFRSDSWIRPLSTNNVFDNAGTLRKSAGSGELLIQTALVNTGAIDSLSGTIVLPQNWRNDGTLRGDAAFQTNVLTNAGDISPGLPDAGQSIATLTLTGALAQTTAGALSFELGAGGVSDVLNVTGTVTFGGLLIVTRLGDYVATVGDSFRVMSFASSSGSALDIVTLGFADGVQFVANYEPTFLELRVIAQAVPEPGSWMLMAGGMVGLALLRRRSAGG